MKDARQKLERVDAWIAQGELDPARVGPIFVTAKRILTRAESPELWSPALQTMDRFLDLIETTLEDPLDWSHSDTAKLFSVLLTVMAEAGQYRFETFTGDEERYDLLQGELLPKMADLREHAIAVAKIYLQQPVFASLAQDIEHEIFPLLDSMGATSGETSELARDRYMPFRIVQVGNVVERLYGFRIRTTDWELLGDEDTPGLLREIYDRKYARFGTSGVRGRWGLDFTEVRAKRVVQAVCDYLKDADVPPHVKAVDLQGKRMVVGYDSRRNARQVAEWAAQVCLANGFKIDFANRDAPTPALVYYLTDYLDEDDVGGLINCTASHNPPEWQGLKFNPRQGWPAPTSLTNFIAARANEYQLMDACAAEGDISRAEERGNVRGFDPIVDYSDWVLESGHGNQRIELNPERIRQHFGDEFVVIDEMHGAARGYLPRLLGEIGVRTKVIHAERDPNLPGLEYANPEEPFINPLKETVAEMDDAILGLGMDTDADRFGVVDLDGTYFRPNQVLPMLVRYLGIDRELKGRVIATQTGSPMLEVLAGMIPDNEAHEPESGVVPAFVDHPFYHRRVGDREDRVYEHTFMVPVGIKYIEEQRRTDRAYTFLKELPDGWRDRILIGGEESSGLTTRGHVTDKDGVWANLLIMDMIAYYGQTVAEIWEDTVELVGWATYGGRELDDEPSNTGRADVDAVLEAKESLINDFLDRFKGKEPGEAQFEGLDVIYSGGIRYDFVELQLQDDQGGVQHFLRVRASGTEPINRIYVESTDPVIAQRLMEAALSRLAELSAEEIKQAHSEWRLVEILSSTKASPALRQAVHAVIEKHEDWTPGSVVGKLLRMLPTVEGRNQKAIRAWIDVLEA